ncbi:MAG: hypothetical protein OEX12_01280 [Gammaproteobacteria bacterium]|nr:hypothetical protein [Gammaproteobacteria bacterium]
MSDKVKILKNEHALDAGGKLDNRWRTDRVRLSMTGKRLQYFGDVFLFCMQVTLAQMGDGDMPTSTFEPADLEKEMQTLYDKVQELKTPLTIEVPIEKAMTAEEEDEYGLW